MAPRDPACEGALEVLPAERFGERLLCKPARFASDGARSVRAVECAGDCRRQPGSAAPDDPRAGEAVGKKLCEAFIQFDQCQLLLGKSLRQKRTGEDACSRAELENLPGGVIDGLCHQPGQRSS